MTREFRVLAVIPARGGSKGLPRKNIRPLAGIPLIAHSIRAAQMTKSINRCIVSTDSDEIAAVSRAYGGDVPFIRPAELAMDDTPMAPVLRHALAAVEEAEESRYDYFVLLEPTSPIRSPEAIDRAVSALTVNPHLDGIVSVSEPHFQPSWVGVRQVARGNHLERFYPNGAGVTRRQDVQRYLRINGNYYVWRTEFIRRLSTSWFDEGHHGMEEIPEEQALSIDTESEFRLAEVLLAAGFYELPWLKEGL